MALDKQNKNVTNYYKILLRKYPRKFVPIWIELDIWRKSEINKEMKPFSLIIINYATQKKIDLFVPEMFNEHNYVVDLPNKIIFSAKKWILIHKYKCDKC